MHKAGSITSHFTDEKTEHQRGETTGSRSHRMVPDKGTHPPSPGPFHASPCFVDFLGCFNLGGYKSAKEILFLAL